MVQYASLLQLISFPIDIYSLFSNVLFGEPGKLEVWMCFTTTVHDQWSGLDTYLFNNRPHQVCSTSGMICREDLMHTHENIDQNLLFFYFFGVYIFHDICHVNKTLLEANPIPSN